MGDSIMNLHKWLLTVLITLVLGMGSSFAQNGSDLVDIQQVNNPGINHSEAVKSHGLDYLLTVISDDLLNNISAMSVDGNTASINQFGSNNSATIDQSGNRNISFIQMGTSDNPVSQNTAIVDQDGQQLISIVNIQGDNNYLDFEQSGQDRGVFFNFQGSNLQFNATQQGASFQLTPRSLSMPVIDITTTRQALPIIISNN